MRLWNVNTSSPVNGQRAASKPHFIAWEFIYLFIFNQLLVETESEQFDRSEPDYVMLLEWADVGIYPKTKTIDSGDISDNYPIKDLIMTFSCWIAFNAYVNSLVGNPAELDFL